MIILSSNAQAIHPTATVVEERSVTSGYETAAAGGPPLEFSVSEFEGEQTELQTKFGQAPKDYDWSQQKTTKEFIRLQQTFMANKASSDEIETYQAMKRDRNSVV